MAMKFQYDEQGDSFVYFVLAFLVLLLVPSSYFFWPRLEVNGEQFLPSETSLCLSNSMKMPHVHLLYVL